MSSYETTEMRLAREAAERAKAEELKRIRIEKENRERALRDIELLKIKIEDCMKQINELLDESSITFISRKEKEAIDEYLTTLQIISRTILTFDARATSADIWSVYNDAKQRQETAESTFTKTRAKKSLSARIFEERQNAHLRNVLANHQVERHRQVKTIAFEESIDLDMMHAKQVEETNKNNEAFTTERLRARYFDYECEYALLSKYTTPVDDLLSIESFRSLQEIDKEISRIALKTQKFVEERRIEELVRETLNELGITTHQSINIININGLNTLHSDSQGNSIRTFINNGFLIMEPVECSGEISDGADLDLVQEHNCADTETIDRQKRHCEFHKAFIKKLKEKGVNIKSNTSHAPGECKTRLVAKGTASHVNQAVKNKPQMKLKERKR